MSRFIFHFYYRARLETSHVPRLPICCDAGKALSPTVGLEALPWREQRSKRQVFQTDTLLVLSCVDLRTKGFQPSCAQNRLAQNQNCIRLGLGRFSEVPLSEKGQRQELERSYVMLDENDSLVVEFPAVFSCI